MTRFRLLSSLLCTSVVVLVPLRAEAAALDAARKAYADLAYEVCRTQAAEALEDPATLPERVDAYRLLGLCQAAVGDTDAAREAFVKMVAIQPDAELPKGLSPRFTSSYLEAKGFWLGKKPLELVIEEDRSEGKNRIVRIALKDAAGLIDKITWQDDEGERGPSLKAAERMELELPAEVAVALVALDASGGVVLERSLTGPELAALPDPAVGSQGSVSGGAGAGGEEEPGAGPWLWVGVAAGAGALLAGGAAAAVTGYLLTPPQSATLESQVVFGNP